MKVYSSSYLIPSAGCDLFKTNFNKRLLQIGCVSLFALSAMMEPLKAMEEGPGYTQGSDSTLVGTKRKREESEKEKEKEKETENFPSDFKKFKTDSQETSILDWFGKRYKHHFSPPNFRHFSDAEMKNLSERANGNEEAQKEFIARAIIGRKLSLTPDRIYKPLGFSCNYSSWSVLERGMGEDPVCDFFILSFCEEGEINRIFPGFFQKVKEKAEKGDTHALAHLGYMYELGKGVEGGVNLRSAFEYYAPAAKKGNPFAYCRFGRKNEFFYERTKNIKLKNTAYEYFKRAADQNDAEGLYLLARDRFREFSKDKESPDYKSYLSNPYLHIKAGLAGNWDAQNWLNNFYLSSNTDFSNNMHELTRWLMAFRHERKGQEPLDRMFLWADVAYSSDSSFKEMVENLEKQILGLFAEDSLQLGLNNPDGSFDENKFGIKKLYNTN